MTSAKDLGYCTLSPEGDVACGSYGTWRVVYAVGRHGMDNGAVLCLSKLGNWGRLQGDHPARPDYVSASTSGPAKLTVRTESHMQPIGTALTVRVSDDSLMPGDVISVVLGDTSGGSKGHRAPTWAQTRADLSVYVDPYGKGTFERIPDTPSFRLVAAPVARLRVLAPSQAVVGQRLELLVRAEDPWCNTAVSCAGRVRLSACGPAGRISLAEARPLGDAAEGLSQPTVVLPETGLYEIEVEHLDTGLTARSNPVLCRAEQPERALYWGDIHGQTGETGGTGTIAAYFDYGRSDAALDFCAHTANDHSFATSDYEMLRHTVRAAHQPGRFVTFLGYEWSGNAPNGGDHNVYYLTDDQPIHRSSHWQVRDRSDEHNDRQHVNDLCDAFRGRHDVLVIPHIGGRRANLDFHDPMLMPVIEVCSCHGIFDWFIEEAMARGLRVGFIGGTDDHSCRPGLSSPQRPTLSLPGGLCAVYAQELTRQAIWEALKARRCYATTGQRIILSVTVDGHTMGEAFAASSPPRIEVEVIGTGELERVELYNRNRLLYSHPCMRNPEPIPGRVLITWTGARVKSRARQSVWDGELRLDRGRIVHAEGVAFETTGLEDEILSVSEKAVAWRSVTSGDMDGLLLDLDTPSDAVVTFSTGPAAFAFSPGQLESGPLVVPAGGVNQAVRVSRAYHGLTSKQAQFEYIDRDIAQGLNAYYVRVVQGDNSRAWSSPIFADST